MSQTKIAIIGANGTLGPHILSALQPHSVYKVTILTRQSSTSTYPPTLTTVTLPDDLPHGSLVHALARHDVLIMCVSGSQSALQVKLIGAAVEAGVSRVIPADFGSCDSSDPRTLARVPLYPEKKRVRDHLVGVAEATGGKVSWTSVVCGHFLDFGLRGRLWLMDVPRRRVRVVDGGDVRFSASMLRTVGEAVVGVLSHLEETRDRIVYVQSLATTQNELVRVVERVVGGAFEVEHVQSDELIGELRAVLDRKPGDYEASEDLVGVEGMVNADWTVKETFVNELFGLPEEDLEACVREALDGWSGLEQ